MERRRFIASASLIPFLRPSSWQSKAPLIVPPGLSKGDTVGLVAPASSLTRSAFDTTISNLQLLGFKVKYSDNLRVRRGFLSGTDEQRAADLHSMYSDVDVRGIICARGGYGSARLLPLLDFDLIRNNPKPLIGYSDITALHQAIYQHARVVTYHGPVGASDFNEFTLKSFEETVFKGKKSKIQAEEVTTICGGKAEGPLAGGNLSLLSSLVGTPYALDFSGHILFLEEVGESTYRVDRMLTQLKQSGAIDNVAGIAIGYFTNCEEDPEDDSFESSLGLTEVFKEQFEDLGVPVLYGLPFGHEPENVTLPIGVRAELDADKGSLQLAERPIDK